jgi:hypothetical protein
MTTRLLRCPEVLTENGTAGLECRTASSSSSLLEIVAGRFSGRPVFEIIGAPLYLVPSA